MDLDSIVMSPAELAKAIREQKALLQRQREEEELQSILDEKMAIVKAVKAQQEKFNAANSHQLTDKYMQEFEKAWAELNATDQGDGADPAKQAAASKTFAIEGPKAKASNPKSALAEVRTRNIINYAKTTAATPFVRHPPTVLETWKTGPVDKDGTKADVSDRPTLCSTANWSKKELVVGSSDHALYVIDAEKGTKKRQLYNKSSGHQEWVTAATYTPDGKVVSGGMDSKMWMWPAGTTRGILMEGHTGPISKLSYDGSTGLVVSASYDKTVRMWQCGSRGEEKVQLLGHDAPVMELGINTEGKIITGDRSGHIILWDTSASDVSWRMKNVHKGQVSCLAWCDGDDADVAGLFVSGGQDGHVRVWDPRERKNPARLQLHVNKEGRGAVTGVCAGGIAAANMVVTCGADMTCRVLDPRKSFALMSTVELPNFPYSLAVAGGLALVGCGDGSLHVVDIKGGSELYSLQAHTGAVRTIEACQDRLFTSGDDGNTMLWKFGSTAADGEGDQAA